METTRNDKSMLFTLLRNAHFFSNRPGAAEGLKAQRELVRLATDQLLHPPAPGDYVVRRGKLRLSHFLPDGREITRSVLQAGSVFLIRARDGSETAAPDPEADHYDLADIVIMALNEGELWVLPADTLKNALQIED